MGERFEILRRIDTRRRWKSLDDERVCLLCDRKFTGRQIEFRKNRSGRVELYCPTDGCNAASHEWVYADDRRLVAARNSRSRPLFGLAVQIGTT